MADSPKLTGEGRLVVRVRTGDGALPIPGATVTVRGSDPENASYIRTAVTDTSGISPVFTLAAPSAAASLSPGARQPYALYDILVVKPGYYRHENLSVPVFDGILSTQGASMIPLAPYEGDDTYPLGNLTFRAGQSLGEGETDA